MIGVKFYCVNSWVKEVLLRDVLGVQLPGEISFEPEHHSLWGAEDYLAHGSKWPLKKQAEPQIDDVPVDENTTEQKEEVLVLKENHLLL